MPTTPRPVLLHDQPCLAMALPAGDRVVVALQGAQVLSWTTADGVERLYVSPKSTWDGHTAIRGGVPVCFPQFNQRGPLAKHGFARNLPWRAVPVGVEGTMRMVLQDSEATRAVWPHAFAITLTVSLAPATLRMTCEVHNPGDAPFDFALALHSYLRTADAEATQLHGLAGQAHWDAVGDRHHPAAAGPIDAALAFGPETDRVYAATTQPLRLVSPRATLAIAQSPTLTETVVWNPGPVLAAQMADLPDDGWRHMLCVEAARINAPVRLGPGERWSAWQQLAALPSA